MNLTEAIEYLRSRGKYIADQGCKWKPTNAAKTNIKKTIEEYRKWEKKVLGGAVTANVENQSNVVFGLRAKTN